MFWLGKLILHLMPFRLLLDRKYVLGKLPIRILFNLRIEYKLKCLC